MTEKQPVGVLVVDDEPMVCRFLSEELSHEPGITILGTAQDGAEAVDQTLRLQPAVVLMDLRMPGVDGVRATTELTKLNPAPKVIILTTLDADEHVLAALHAGAAGFVLKSAPPEQLIPMVFTAARGGAVLSPDALAALLERSTHTDNHDQQLQELTPREQDVLQLLSQGLSNGQIGARLFISTGTVKAIVSRLITHLALTNRTQLALWYTAH